METPLQAAQLWRPGAGQQLPGIAFCLPAVGNWGKSAGLDFWAFLKFLPNYYNYKQAEVIVGKLSKALLLVSDLAGIKWNPLHVQ